MSEKKRRTGMIYRGGPMPKTIKALYYGSKAKILPRVGELLEVENAKTGDTNMYTIIAVDRRHHEYSAERIAP